MFICCQNLLGDTPVEQQYGKTNTATDAGRCEPGQRTVTVVQAVLSLLALLNSRVRCKVCPERAKPTMIQSDQTSTGSGLSSGESSSGNGSGHSTRKTTTDMPNIEKNTIPVSVVGESGSGISSGDAVISESGKGHATVIEVDELSKCGENRRDPDAIGSVLKSDECALLSGNSTHSQKKHLKAVHHRLYLHLCMNQCWLVNTRLSRPRNARYSSLDGSELVIIISTLLTSLTKTHFPVKSKRNQKGQSVGHFVKHATDQLSAVTNLTNRLKELTGSLSGLGNSSCCRWNVTTSSGSQRSASIEAILRETDTLVKALSNGISEALSFMKFTYYFKDIIGQVKTRCEYVPKKEAGSLQILSVQNSVPNSSRFSSFYEQTLTLSYCKSLMTHESHSNQLDNIATEPPTSSGLSRFCLPLAKFPESNIDHSVCACEQLRLLSQLSEVLNKTNFLSENEDDLFVYLKNLTCRKREMIACRNFSSYADALPKACQCPIQRLNLACPRFFYAETNVTEHWNADARAGLYAALRSVLNGMTVRGAVPTTGDSMLFKCGVRCGVGAVGLRYNQGQYLVAAAWTIEVVWCIIFSCSLLWVCGKKRYRRSMFRFGYLLLQIPYGLSTMLRWITSTAYVGKNRSWCFSDETLFEGMPHTRQEVLCTVVGRLMHIEKLSLDDRFHGAQPLLVLDGEGHRTWRHLVRSPSHVVLDQAEATCTH